MSDETLIGPVGTRNRSNWGSRKALILVRNAGTHDSRVLREASTLASLGYTPEVLAVVSEDEPRTEATIEGIRFRRLSPGSPFSWLRSRLRRSRDKESSQPSGGESLQPDATSPSGGGSRQSVLVRIHRWLRTLDYYRRAIAVVRSERPTLIHCNDYNTMWVGVAARLMGGTAVVYDAHELWPDRNLRPEPRWWLLACECAVRARRQPHDHREPRLRRRDLAPLPREAAPGDQEHSGAFGAAAAFRAIRRRTAIRASSMSAP